MSYIRCTSNPEGLYIWSNGETVIVQMGSIDIGKIPTNIFNGLIKKYIGNYNYDVKYNGAEIKEIQDGIGNFKMELSYDNWSCLMWRVTWDYIVLSNIGSIKKCQKNKQLNKLINN